MKKSILSLAVTALILASCGGSDTQAPAAETEAAAPAAETTAPEAETSSNIAEVTLNAGDDMKFDITEIKVKEGQTVKLTLNHTGKNAKAAMGHNFILLKQGVNMADFDAAAIAASATDYIPADKAGDIIAHTKLIGGGESDTIEFPAPAKGTYEFLCSFPGHSAMMKGSFIVE